MKLTLHQSVAPGDSIMQFNVDRLSVLFGYDGSESDTLGEHRVGTARMRSLSA